MAIKKQFLTDQNPMLRTLRETPGIRVPQNAGRLMICFSLLMFAGALLSSLAGRIAEQTVTGTEPSDTASLLLALYLTGIPIVLVLCFCRFGENRPLRTTGMTLKNALPQYLTGAAAGYVMFGTAVLLAWKCGALTFTEQTGPLSAGTLTALLTAWLVQGFSEEIAFRGWLMISAGTHHGVKKAVILSAFMFSVFHFGNEGISIPAAVNLFLFGVFAAFYVLRTGSIWGAAAMHGIWNFAQGNLFGIKVSGMDMPDSIWHFSSVNGMTWLNGGAFGMEGGLAVTAVLAAGIAVLLILPAFRREPVRNGAPPENVSAGQ